jgi:hypothetical protein
MLHALISNGMVGLFPPQPSVRPILACREFRCMQSSTGKAMLSTAAWKQD